ncbi:MAG: DinB family protein [Chloroflexi bacterium]|nr:DinB family protein [Chloroflexota bacterium]
MRLAELAKAQNVDREKLIEATNEMIDLMLQLIQDAVDEDVVFTPEDPEAEDPFAENPEDVHVGWTLGHIIAHVTASSEETCAQAAELARGVEVCGRSRYEVPWREIRTVDDVVHRLEESRRIRLAYLNAWPDQPHLERVYTPYRSPHNCITRVLAGLFHDYSHLEQIKDVMQQARAARS